SRSHSTVGVLPDFHFHFFFAEELRLQLVAALLVVIAQSKVDAATRIRQFVCRAEFHHFSNALVTQLEFCWHSRTNGRSSLSRKELQHGNPLQYRTLSRTLFTYHD